MAIGSGIASQLVYQDEVTYGVAPSLASAIPLEFKSETLELKKTTMQGQGLHASGLYDRAGRRVLTNYDAGGGITLDLQARRLNKLLYAMFGSYGQGNAVLTQMGVTGVYQAKHFPGGTIGHSLCFQKGVPGSDGVVSPFTYVGCKIQDWTISVSTGSIAQLDLTINGRNELGGAGNADPLNGAVPTLATWTSTPGMDLFHFKEATLITGTPSTTANFTTLTGPTTLANIKDVSMKHSIALDDARYFLGGGGFCAEPIENGFRSITGSFTAEYLSTAAMYNAFAADTPLAIKLLFVGPITGSSGSNTELLEILVSNVKLDGESPKVGGPAVVDMSCSFTGLDNEVDNQIQALYQTTDTV